MRRNDNMKLRLCKKFGTLLDFEEKLLKRRFFNTYFAIFASKMVGGCKYCKNERLCNSLIINNKSFEGQKWVCNWCLIRVQLRLNHVAIGAQIASNSYSIATQLDIQLSEGIGDWG
jgi:hypothetical protein